MTQHRKPGSRIVKFGDVVRNANVVERDALTAGIERIVGLEHLDPGNLHIRRWNTPESGTSFCFWRIISRSSSMCALSLINFQMRTASLLFSYAR